MDNSHFSSKFTHSICRRPKNKLNKCITNQYQKKKQVLLRIAPTKLQLSKAQSSKDYWLKVSKQKKEERQGQKLPCLSEFPF
jgi:hypothetical protein